MPRKKQLRRCFTHADIAKYYEDYWGKIPDPVYTLKSIELLPEITPPAWRIQHTATYSEPYVRTAYYSLLVLQCTYSDGTPHLNLAQTEALPEGYSTTQEEDEEIQRRRLAQEAISWAKWKEERKQDNGNHDLSESL